MSAIGAKARKLAEAHARAVSLTETRTAEAAALATFDEPEGAARLVKARRAVEDAAAERDVLATALEAAEKAHAEAVAQEAARELEARHGRLRGEAVALGEDIVKALVTVGKLATKNAEIVNGLPPTEYYHYFIPTYAEQASKTLSAGAKNVTQIDLRILIANP